VFLGKQTKSVERLFTNMVLHAFRVATGDFRTDAQHQQEIFDYLMSLAAFLRRFATERRLAMFMVLAAALLSTFLTNDVALFIVVPLTITLKRLCEIPVNRLIIFEALAVNAGSLLTPIGNPQNILIWGRSGLSFAGFIAQMAPLAGAMMLTLLLLCWCCRLLQYRLCGNLSSANRRESPGWSESGDHHS
jgi:di/tricarboxylate transporter